MVLNNGAMERNLYGILIVWHLEERSYMRFLDPSDVSLVTL